MYCKLLRLFWLINKINLLWFKLNETLSDISNKPFTFTSFLDVSEGQKETHWEGSGLPSCVHAAFSSCWSALGVCFHLQPDFISASHFICLMDPLNYRNGLFADTIQMCPEWFVCQQRFFFFLCRQHRALSLQPVLLQTLSQRKSWLIWSVFPELSSFLSRNQIRSGEPGPWDRTVCRCLLNRKLGAVLQFSWTKYLIGNHGNKIKPSLSLSLL